MLTAPASSAAAQVMSLNTLPGSYQAGDLLFSHDALGQLQHLFGGGGVQCGGVLVQQQQLGGDQRCHEQGQRLPLAAGKQSHRLLHAVLKAHIQQRQLFAEHFLVLAGGH